MSTSAPVIEVWDIPIERPREPERMPLALPEASPERWFTPIKIAEPEKVPVKV